MRAKGKVLGVFSVFGEAGHQLYMEEMTLLASIADQVGVAVEHAWLYQQAEQLAVMEERERLARDLHDSVTQSLYCLTLFAEAGRRLIKSGDLERAESYLARLADTAQDALKEMRLLVYELRPPPLEREGLVGAIQQRLGAVERRVGVKAHLLVDDAVRLPAPVEEGLYRIVQEALNNALKHAMATSVTVRIHVAEEHVELEVVDDGIGFDPAAAGKMSGMGLANMQERAKRLGGALQVVSAPGKGTKVIVSVGEPRSAHHRPHELGR
jgi:signal transduction histidine kinase